MSSTGKTLRVSPASLSRDEFLQRFGGVYEHSPWVAELLWDSDAQQLSNDVSQFHRSMADIVDNSSHEKQLTLIRAHPDLAGKAALKGELTTASSDEQSGAGLDQCTDEELQRFTRLNQQYKDRFDFPFIMAVRHSDRYAIMAAFEQRLKYSKEEEFARAMKEIHKIARFRLEEL